MTQSEFLVKLSHVCEEAPADILIKIAEEVASDYPPSEQEWAYEECLRAMKDPLVKEAILQQALNYVGKGISGGAKLVDRGMRKLRGQAADPIKSRLIKNPQRYGSQASNPMSRGNMGR